MNNELIYNTPRLTLKEACEFLGCKMSTLYKGIREDKVKVLVSHNIKYLTMDEAKRVLKEKSIKTSENIA